MKILKRYPETLGLPLAVMVFWFAPKLIRYFDSTAGQLDTGMLQFFVLAPCYILLSNLLAFLGIKFNFKYLYKCYLNDFEQPGSFWHFFAVWAALMVVFNLALIALV